jgi:hypothetical protein
MRALLSLLTAGLVWWFGLQRSFDFIIYYCVSHMQVSAPWQYFYASLNYFYSDLESIQSINEQIKLLFIYFIFSFLNGIFKFYEI